MGKGVSQEDAGSDGNFWEAVGGPREAKKTRVNQTHWRGLRKPERRHAVRAVKSIRVGGCSQASPASSAGRRGLDDLDHVDGQRKNRLGSEMDVKEVRGGNFRKRPKKQNILGPDPGLLF